MRPFKRTVNFVCTSHLHDKFVLFLFIDKAFHVYWERVYLQNKQDVGPFTFSASLYQDGDIVFAYYFLPIPVTQIEDDKHPVKVGVSDAYIIDKTVFQARRKTIFEYHRVNFPGPEIRNFTKIKLTPLPTCHTFNDCQSCLQNDIKFRNVTEAKKIRLDFSNQLSNLKSNNWVLHM